MSHSHLPLLPVGTLISEAIDDGSSTYSDGDNPGWYRYRWFAERGELWLYYQPDEDCSEHRATAARFQLLDCE